MRVLFVTSEVYPLAKTGGLADVSRALPIALKDRGADVRVLLPAYPSALRQVENARVVAKLEPMLGVPGGNLISGFLPGTELPVWLVHAPSLFLRAGGLYQSKGGRDWPDNALRFAYLSHVGAALALGRTPVEWQADVVHANDWHAGLLPLLLSFEREPRPGTIFTAHNMAFQGNFPASVSSAIRIPNSCLTAAGCEFFGQVSFLKAGLRYADRVTTVSPGYAAETLTPEFGAGMDGVLRERGAKFSGILNGIDDALWNPLTDRHIPQNFWAGDILGKRTCKSALQQELGLRVSPATPLIGFVSRLTHQKMADVVADAIPWIVEQNAQFVLVGEGDAAIHAAFAEAQVRAPESVAVAFGYDEPLAHRLQAGSDIILAPARFEPCGLTQLYGLRYGAVPVVRRTGGLADTVVDATPPAMSDRTATGFVFEDPDLMNLVGAIERALAVYKEPLTWRRLQLQGMAQVFGWTDSAEKYQTLYEAITGNSLRPLCIKADEAQMGQAPLVAAQ